MMICSTHAEQPGFHPKVVIIGASGTGKTTLAHAVAKRLGCPVFDSDHYWHVQTDPPYQLQRFPEERISLLSADISGHPSWVISGNVIVWDPPLKTDISLVVFLYVSPDIRLQRIQQREQERFGSRILSGGDMESEHKDFMKWTAGYDEGTCSGINKLSKHKELLQSALWPTLAIEEPMSTEEQVELIMNRLTS
jgi:adenylate kinase family enzyme